jgi:hypothetical protein
VGGREREVREGNRREEREYVRSLFEGKKVFLKNIEQIKRMSPSSYQCTAYVASAPC